MSKEGDAGRQLGYDPAVPAVLAAAVWLAALFLGILLAG
jgi:hypothetical protein